MTPQQRLLMLAESAKRPAHATRAPFGVRIANLLAILLPFVGLVVAIALLWGVAMNWVFLALFIAMYIVTGLGITIGYHRLFTHKSFETSRPMKAPAPCCMRSVTETQRGFPSIVVDR